MNDMEQVLKQRVRIHYRGRSGSILTWYITTFFLSLIKLGLYLPVGANRLLRYLTQKTDIYMYDVVETSDKLEEMEEIEES